MKERMKEQKRKKDKNRGFRDNNHEIISFYFLVHEENQWFFFSAQLKSE